MRWHRIGPGPRLVLSALGLASLLSLGLTTPRAPSGEELRAVSYMLAGSSFADICGSGGHPGDGDRCQQCCLAATAPAPAMPRIATRRIRRPHHAPAPARPGLHRPPRRDWSRSVRAPPAG